LLFHERDLATQEYFIEQASRDPSNTGRADRMRTLLSEMMAYVSTPTCRQLAILHYFNDADEQALGPCNLCDRCISSQPVDRRAQDDEDDANAKAVMETISWCGGRFGVSRIVDIVRGSRSKTMLAYGAEDCPTYGRCKTQSKLSVTQLVKRLIDAGYLRIEGLDYPTLAITRIGQEVLQGSRSVTLEKLPGETVQEPAGKPTRERLLPAAVPKSALVDHQLFERLRRLRLELAEEEGVAPFVIFHDKTLRTIASHKPLTSAALLAIPGIGETKAERYGRRVLELLTGK
jgi:ATP-dependent DNA helicase RecQ